MIVSDFFYKDSKIFLFRFFSGERGEGGGRVSELFYYESKLKIKENNFYLFF